MVEENSKQWVKEFSKCPACGGENRMFEQMGKELKERGLASEDMNFYYDMKNGALANQDMMTRLPIGGELPAFSVAQDICLDCGCIYTVRLERTNAKKGLAPVQLAPNRAARRAGLHGGKSFQIPPLNNFKLS